MANINFPSSPTQSQVYTFGNSSWIFNGTAWVSTNGALGSSGSSGSTGSSGSSGSSGLSGTSGTSGISGFKDNDWLYLQPSSGSIASTGNVFILSGSVSSNVISYNSSNGRITLEANKTYNLRASLALANSVSNAEINYQWINVTAGNVNIGNNGGVLVVSSTASAGWQPVAEAIISTTTSTEVALKSIFSNSSGGLQFSQCYLVVQEIYGYSGTSGSSGTSGTSGTSGSAGTSGTSGSTGTSGSAGSSGSSGSSGSAGTSGVSGNVPVTGSWTLATGTNTVSFTVTGGQSYVMWVNGNIPSGIVNWNATVTLSNSNVPVIGVQYGWYYAAGGALVLTSIPSQIIGTAGSISTSSPAVSNTNTFTFGITNNSVTTQTVYYGYIKVS